MGFSSGSWYAWFFFWSRDSPEVPLMRVIFCSNHTHGFAGPALGTWGGAYLGVLSGGSRQTIAGRTSPGDGFSRHPLQLLYSSENSINQIVMVVPSPVRFAP